MYFSLLGPVEVWHDGRLLPVGSARERFVLATMLLNAGKLTTVSRLVDALWEEPPRSAKAQLHNIISNLRRRLVDDVIVTRATGYELHLGAHELDVNEFRRLVASGRAASASGDHELAAGLLNKALSLWRGPALADVAEQRATVAREALHDDLLFAAEANLGVCLELGLYHEVLRELVNLLAEHPYRERLHEIKMRALVAAGRRADALACYREVYRRFTSDLGLAPGHPLRDLERQILRGAA
jgi:DNA-binding SARP family transcriptional activator